jgi:hypothetical protein
LRRETSYVNSEARDNRSISRRDFVKGVTVAGAAGSILYGGRFLIPPSPRFSYRTSQRSLTHVVPTSDEEIQFINETEEPFYLPPVGYSWSVDGKLVSNSRAYSCRLPETKSTGTPHTVELDGIRAFIPSSFRQTIDVDPARLPEYPERKMDIPIKGVVYRISDPTRGSPWRSPTDDEMAEDLQVIHDELGCNAIRIFGDYKDWPDRRQYFDSVDELVLRCASKSIDVGFDVIAVSPVYDSLNIDETVRRVGSLAPKVEALSKMTDKTVLYVVGNSVSFFASGIVEGTTDDERLQEALRRKDDPIFIAELNRAVERLLGASRKNAPDLKLSYAAGPLEANMSRLKWDQMDVDVIGIMTYLDDASRQYLPSMVSDSKRYGKPVFSIEFGSKTVEGAFHQVDLEPETRNYNEQDQATGISRTLEFLVESGVDGCFLFNYKEKERDLWGGRGYSILRFRNDSVPLVRKLGFHAYKSHQRVT